MFLMSPKVRDLIKQAQRRKAEQKHVSTPTTFLTSATPRSRTQAPISMEEYLNYGTGPAKNFYTTNGAGSMSLSPLASADALVGKAAQDLLGLGMKFAEGGKVAVSANAIKAIKEAISHLQNKDRARAVNTLRASREALANPDVSRSAQDLLNPRSSWGEGKLRELVEQDTNRTKMPTLAEGGEVEAPMGAADPQQLYEQYQQLLMLLESGQLDEQQELLVIQQLQQIEQALEAMGVELPEEEGQTAATEAQLPDLMAQLTRGTAGLS